MVSLEVRSQYFLGLGDKSRSGDPPHPPNMKPPRTGGGNSGGL